MYSLFKEDGIVTLWLAEERSSKVMKGDPETNSSSRDEQSFIVETTLFPSEFIATYTQARRKDRVTWDDLHKLEDEQHDPLAQAIIAIGYRSGWFLNDSMISDQYGARCLEWLRSQQDKCSFFCLGQFYALGVGVQSDNNEAVRYWRLAAEDGCQLSQFSLGWMEKENGNIEESVKWFQLAANQGSCFAQHALGICCLEGEGMATNLGEAMRWFRLAADQGYAESQFAVGFHYLAVAAIIEEDDDYEHELIDWIEAAIWFQMASEQGLLPAQLFVSVFHMCGFGVAMRGNLLSGSS